MFDLIVKNGTIVDGTGNAAFVGDIAVQDGRIAAIGEIAGEACRTIDAAGLLVTPGFIDVHTHYDGQVLWDSVLAPTIWHGVSTVVIGNCGVGFAPARAGDRTQLIDIMSTVEDIPAESLSEGLPWDWETYPEYLDAIDARPRTIDVASMITHASLRIYVMGERSDEPATPRDIETMCEMVREALRAGAVGFSTSRTVLHTRSNGTTIPGTDCEETELTALAHAIFEASGGKAVMEVVPAGIAVPEPKQLVEEVEMMVRIASATNCPIVFSLVQSKARPREYRDALDRAEAAHSAGVPIYPEVSTRPISTLMGFQGSFHPFGHLPSYAALMEMPLDQRIAVLKEPATRERMLTDEAPGQSPVFGLDGFWADVYSMGPSMNYYPRPEDSIQHLADVTGQDPKALAYDAMLENDGKSFLMFTIANWGEKNSQPLREMVNSPASLIGLADGGAHVTAILDSSQPTSFLIDWVRDRAEGDANGLPIETAIRKLSLANAEIFGLHDRGALKEGLRADLNIIDLDGLSLAAPMMTNDLPLGRPRLEQRAKGFAAIVVNGELVLENGELTGNLPGRLARRSDVKALELAS